MRWGPEGGKSAEPNPDSGLRSFSILTGPDLPQQQSLRGDCRRGTLGRRPDEDLELAGNLKRSSARDGSDRRIYNPGCGRD